MKTQRILRISKKIILEEKRYQTNFFQDNNLLTDFTAIENVMMPLIIKGERPEMLL